MPAFGAPEQATLVNEAGEIIGHMERTAMGPDDMSLAIIAWLTNPEGKILIAQRSDRVYINPGLWSAAAEGFVTYGDTPEKTVVREVHEELGIDNVSMTRLPGSIMHGSTRGKRYKIGFKGTVTTPIEDLRLQVEEVAEAAYLDPQELLTDWIATPDKYVGYFGLLLKHFTNLTLP